jgi:hypothetical protein
LKHAAIINHLLGFHDWGVSAETLPAAIADIAGEIANATGEPVADCSAFLNNLCIALQDDAGEGIY